MHCWINRLPYTYLHWLYDVFIHIIYTNFSYFGLYISTIVSFIILILSVYIINLKTNKNELFSTLIVIIFDDAMNMNFNYAEKFEFYNVSHVLICKSNMLYKILLKNLEYNIIYQDEYFVLFERLSD